MYCNQTRFRLLGLLLALFVLSFSGSVQAQRPETTEAFVYGVNATTPGEVFANFSPPQVEEIYILANRVSVLAPRRTKVFFWPLTQRYRGNWEELNESLDGVLEVVVGDRVITTVSITPYTVQYIAAGSTIGELYIGEQALAEEAQFHRSRETYLKTLTEYRQARLIWLDAARTGSKSREQLLASEPRWPVAFTTLSVGLQQGFPLRLEAGEYQIRMRGYNGAIITGSERTLQVFESRQTTLGYEVFPEERWSVPEQVDAATEAISAAPGTVIYLRPRLMHQYPALAMERLRDSQFSGDVAQNWRWLAEVGQSDLAHDVLEIIRHGQVEERISRTSYSVRQNFNRDLGYEILPYDVDTPRLTPRVDFIGFRIELPQDRDRFTIRLGPQTGAPFAGAVRQVRVMPESFTPFLLPVVILVLAFGLFLYLIYFFWTQYHR